MEKIYPMGNDSSTRIQLSLLGHVRIICLAYSFEFASRWNAIIGRGNVVLEQVASSLMNHPGNEEGPNSLSLLR